MKASFGTAAAIIALSLAVWMLFYVITPGAPLTPPETFAVVGACGAVVLSARWILARLRKARGGDEKRP